MNPNKSKRLPHPPAEYFIASPVRPNVTRLLALCTILLLSLLVCIPTSSYSQQTMSNPPSPIPRATTTSINLLNEPAAPLANWLAVLSPMARAGNGLLSSTQSGVKDEQPLSSWVQTISGTINNLFSVHFVTANEGWAVGLSNTILHTTDGGANWAAQTNKGSRPISSYLGVSGDDKLDLAVANGGSANVTILLGNGAGGFNPPTNYFVGDSQNAIALGDFNSDGRIDLACAGASANVFILPGNGIGGFGSPASFAVSSQPLAIAAADFNLDSKLDLVTADYNTNKLSILLGNGASGFGAATSIDAGVRPRSIVAGDFSNDGRMDLAVANEGSNNVAVHLGNGAGGFSAGTAFDLGAIPLYVIAGRFDSDNRLDLVATMHTSGAAVLLNDCCGYAISPASAHFSVTGSEGMFNLTTSMSCNWSAASNASWIQLSSEASGSDPAEISYIVRDNFSPLPRFGTITIAGLTFTITLDGETDCTYNIAPLFGSYSATGGVSSINLFTGEQCAWQAVSKSGWITITSGCCGIGNGSVTYLVAPNPGPSGRAGTITIDDITFNVKQKGN